MSERCTKQESLFYLVEHGLQVATVLDVGVQHQTRELRENFAEAKHLLFEPVREYHDEIRKHYAGCDYDLFEVALSDQTGQASLQTFDFTGGGGISHSSIGALGSGDRSIVTMRLDDFLSQNSASAPYLLKVDVDGAELQILQGAIHTIGQCVCVIVECPISLDDGLFFGRARFLREQGFVLWDVVDLCYYKNQLSQVDLVFLRQDIKARLFSPWTESAFDVTQWEAKWQ